jgi:nucleoside-diphosphate-sugar epimerase
MTIRWITRQLGTAPASAVETETDLSLIDVRNLVDKAGNSVEATRQKIQEGLDSISQGKRTVICCDYGMSRSNAVAVGVLASFEKIGFDAALRKVLDATGETEIKLQPLSAVREALGESLVNDSEKKQRSILVTGGSGSLGKAFQAASGHEYLLVAPSSDELDISSGSTQLSLLANEEDVDCIVHLANPRVFSSNVAIGQTLSMLRNVMDVCLSRDIDLVYPSGSEVYSGYDGTLLADESTTLLPRGPFGEAKALAEILINHSRCNEGLKCSILRSSTVYGPGVNKPKFIFNFIEKALHSKKIVTHCYQNGPPSLDLLYVSDWLRALKKILDLRIQGDINIGSGELISTREIAELIVEKTGSKSLIETITIDAKVASISMNSQKAQEILKWGDLIPFGTGMGKLISETGSRP